MGAKCPKHFGKQESLEHRRSYLRGFRAVNCNGVIIVKVKIAHFWLFSNLEAIDHGVARDVLLFLKTMVS